MATRSVAAAVEAGQKPTYENCVFCLTGRTRRRGRGGRHGGRRARCDRVADGTAGRRAAWGTAGCRAARTPLPTCRFIRVWSALYRCRGVCVLVGISATPCSCSEWSRALASEALGVVLRGFVSSYPLLFEDKTISSISF